MIFCLKKNHLAEKQKRLRASAINSPTVFNVYPVANLVYFTDFLYLVILFNDEQFKKIKINWNSENDFLPEILERDKANFQASRFLIKS